MASSNQPSMNQFTNSPEISARATFIDQSSSIELGKYQKVTSKNTDRPWWMMSLHPIIRVFQFIQKRRKERETCRYLMSLDDCFLDDIGINRADVVRATRQQNSKTGATAILEKIVQENQTRNK